MTDYSQKISEMFDNYLMDNYADSIHTKDDLDAARVEEEYIEDFKDIVRKAIE